MKALYLDLGNTRLKYWLVDGTKDAPGNIISHMALEHLQAPAELLLGLQDRIDHFSPDFIGVSSVLGKTVNLRVGRQLSRLNTDFEFVRVNCTHPLMHSDYDQDQLGVDRWLQMLGVAESGKKLCVVGCGTALTIDLVDGAKHIGGYIFPNMHLQRQSLQSGTRQIRIPKGDFNRIDTGLTTADAVHRGILLSVVGAIESIAQRHAEFGLVLTGGDAEHIKAHISTAHITQSIGVQDNLVLAGMQRYFQV